MRGEVDDYALKNCVYPSAYFKAEGVMLHKK